MAGQWRFEQDVGVTVSGHTQLLSDLCLHGNMALYLRREQPGLLGTFYAQWKYTLIHLYAAGEMWEWFIPFVVSASATQYPQLPFRDTGSQACHNKLALLSQMRFNRIRVIFIVVCALLFTKWTMAENPSSRIFCHDGSRLRTMV